MADFTTPMFCLPFNLTAPAAGTHCRITFAGSSDGADNVTFDLSTGDLFTNRDYTRADNLAKDWTTQANAAIATAHPTAPGTFAASEYVSGSMKGMLTLTYTAGHANDDITDIRFLDATQLAGADFGFSSDTVTPTSAVIGSTHTWESVYVCSRQWIPHLTGALGVLSWNVEDIDDLVVGEESPSGDSTQDLYQQKKARKITIMTVRAASVMEQWAADSDYLVSGQTVSDPNATFEDFRAFWARTATTALKTCRYHVDMDTAATYHSVLPMADWIGNTTRAAKISNDAPLFYDFDFSVRVV
jgi:hypothetical protein